MVELKTKEIGVRKVLGKYKRRYFVVFSEKNLAVAVISLLLFRRLRRPRGTARMNVKISNIR
jgi:hypothetical protein